MINIISSSYLEALNTEFIQNVGFGRGVLAFIKEDLSIAYFRNCTFIRNSGIYGGLLFVENFGKGMIESSLA